MKEYEGVIEVSAPHPLRQRARDIVSEDVKQYT